MIDKLLTLPRPLVVFDVETTGLDTPTARIVELAFQVWYHDASPLKEWRTLVNPEVPIPAAVTKIHGISDASVQACATCSLPREGHNDDEHQFKIWPTFRQLAPHLLKGFVGCDFAGKNVRFDLRVLSAEMARAGVTWSYAGARIIDADRLEQLGEPRTLSALYEKHTGKKLEGAHQALVDVRATTEVIAAQLQKYSMLPRDLDLLHKAQWPDDWIDGDGKFKRINGVATCTFGKHRGAAMRDIPRGYYEWLLKPTSTFGVDVKMLAADALEGKFPE